MGYLFQIDWRRSDGRGCDREEGVVWRTCSAVYVICTWSRWHATWTNHAVVWATWTAALHNQCALNICRERKRGLVLIFLQIQSVEKEDGDSETLCPSTRPSVYFLSVSGVFKTVCSFVRLLLFVCPVFVVVVVFCLSLVWPTGLTGWLKMSVCLFVRPSVSVCLSLYLFARLCLLACLPLRLSVCVKSIMLLYPPPRYFHRSAACCHFRTVWQS